MNILGTTNFRNRHQRFGILDDDRRRHVYIVGKTGVGKSTLLENMCIQDIQSGHGICFVDVHGDTAEHLLKFIPSNRINDTIYFNPADIEYPVAFNPMENIRPEFRHLVCSGLIGVFKKIWAESWGPRLEYILRNSILALLEHKGSTLLGLQRILSDDSFRGKILSSVSDPVVKGFFTQEFEKMPLKLKNEAVAPIQNKVGQFLTVPLIRNIVGQPKSSFDVRESMDSEKIIILNLAKGKVGEDAASLLGSMLVTKIYLAAMSRVDVPEEQRKDFYLYVDEFQNFATDSFANILSEARLSKSAKRCETLYWEIKEMESPTHKVDCVKNRVALEIEWSNKDPFYDRDLNNFRLLFDLRAISVGVIITKSNELVDIFKDMGKEIWDKFGTTTTWMSKLLPRIEGGGGGGCPILVFGIGAQVYRENE